MNAQTIQHQTISLMNTICDIGAATAVLNWDQETYMPHGGSMTRAEQISTLSTLMHQMLTGDNAKQLVEGIKKNMVQMINLSCASLLRNMRKR